VDPESANNSKCCGGIDECHLPKISDRQRMIAKWSTKAVFFVLYNVYLGFAFNHHYNTREEEDESFGWCDGLGFLVALTAATYATVVLRRVR
jgi:hypothetical protein